MPKKYLFYCKEYARKNEEKFTLESHYSFKLWRPSIINILPQGMPLMPFATWWVMHYCHLFKNRDYGLFVVYDEKKLIHRSCIFPGYFRFPFMSKADLQIGDIWTDPKYRRRGIAYFALKQILDAKSKPGRRFWYIVDDANQNSIELVKKTSFIKVGEGVRRKRFGFGILGYFVITKARS